jgi:hypothetical protein
MPLTVYLCFLDTTTLEIEKRVDERIKYIDDDERSIEIDRPLLAVDWFPWMLVALVVARIAAGRSLSSSSANNLCIRALHGCYLQHVAHVARCLLIKTHAWWTRSCPGPSKSRTRTS